MDDAHLTCNNEVVPTTYLPTGGVALVHGDSRRVLPRLAVGAVDAVVTDPPWNLGRDYGAHDDRMDPADYVAWLGGVLRECRRLAPTVAFLLGRANLPVVDAVLRLGDIRRYRLLWWHREPCDVPEPIVCAGAAAAGGRRCFVAAPPASTGHPCPKPVRLMEWLVERCVPPGGIVLDPFAGTGVTLQAAARTGRRGVGVELEERFCAEAAARLTVLSAPLHNLDAVVDDPPSVDIEDPDGVVRLAAALGR